MQSLTLTQLFGEGVTQDSNYLVIQKSGLPGLIPTSTNTAESLLVAVLLKALENFEGVITDESGNAITDENSKAITYSQDNLYEFLKIFQWDSYIKQRLDNYWFTHTIVVEAFTPDED